MAYKTIITEPSVTIIDDINGKEIMKKLERCARTCYQSYDKAQESPDNFIANIIKRGHESVLEHVSITAGIVTDRGVMAELTRHRIASYSVESTRYCNYTKGCINFIFPIEYTVEDQSLKQIDEWYVNCKASAESYSRLLETGATPQEARSVLNHSLKCEIVVTMNLREWRHFCKLRCAKAAHPHMKEIAIPLLLYFKKELPVLFSDISHDEEFYEKHHFVLLNIMKQSTSDQPKTVQSHIPHQTNDYVEHGDGHTKVCQCDMTENQAMKEKLDDLERRLESIETKLGTVPQRIFKKCDRIGDKCKPDWSILNSNHTCENKEKSNGSMSPMAEFNDAINPSHDDNRWMVMK